MLQCAHPEPQVDLPRFLSRTIDHTIAATTAARTRLMIIVASIFTFSFPGSEVYALTLTFAVSLVASLYGRTSI